ncbi:MAG: toxin [Pseudomonadota bacterium]
MKHINWNTEKSLTLKESRGICFEDVVFHIDKGDMLDDYQHPNQKKYAGQRVMVVGIDNYAYLIPYVENEDEIFLKTIIPSRKATEEYFGGHHDYHFDQRRKKNT